ncbi:RidA family protein [Pseudomonas solani]|uniref:RidA family protein n=1 Tax=Pseudomonas solani TaxID=2731552 RepID=UPI003C2CA890
MTELKRYTRASGTAGQPMPFARAVQTDGWLHVSGQTPLRDGVLVDGGIVPQARQCLNNLLEILDEAGYRPEHVVRCGVWLDDPRDFSAFNAVFLEFFGDHPPARACVVSSMVIDCRVEVDCIAYRAPEGR